MAVVFLVLVLNMLGLVVEDMIVLPAAEMNRFVHGGLTEHVTSNPRRSV